MHYLQNISIAKSNFIVIKICHHLHQQLLIILNFLLKILSRDVFRKPLHNNLFNLLKFMLVRHQENLQSVLLRDITNHPSSANLQQILHLILIPSQEHLPDMLHPPNSPAVDELKEHVQSLRGHVVHLHLPRAVVLQHLVPDCGPGRQDGLVAGKLLALAEEDKIVMMAVRTETAKVLESFGGDGKVVGEKFYHGTSFGGKRHCWKL